MLSRIADAMFWIGRYVERADQTARILDVTLQTITEVAPSGRALPDFTRVQATAVAKNRLLFNITFAQKPDFQSASLIVYLDLDNNPDTGRKDKHHPGVDLMVTFGGNAARLLKGLCFALQSALFDQQGR